MAKRFGIDFGTTNSVASIILHLQDTGSETAAPLTNREDHRPHPSVIWYRGADTIVGRKAKDALGELITGASGDFIRSPKTLLSSPHGLNIGGVYRKPVDLAADIFKFIRKDALDRGYEGESFDQAVVSIPVNMKGHARRELRQAALIAGIRIHQFVHEPLSALYGHLRGNNPDRHSLSTLEGQLILVFDWGGGTLDLTLCKVSEGSLVQIANLGDTQVGGDQFDKRIVQMVREQHQSMHAEADWNKFQPSGKARLIQACEDAKIALSERPSTLVFAPDVLAIQGEAAHIEVEITSEDLFGASSDLIKRGLRRIEEVLAKADASDKDIEFCLATGGTMAMPAIREGLIEIFGPSRSRFTENAETVISEGCAWIAHDNIRLSTAKSLSLLHAGDVFIPTIPSGTLLPTFDKVIQDKFSFYCADPRDGFAKFLIGRSRWPDDEGDMIPYGQVAVRVDPDAKPLRERLELELQIDHDLVVTVKVKSEGTGFERSMEIHDLEFGLSIKPNTSIPSPKPARLRGNAGDIRVKANVTDDSEALDLVPGEILRDAFPLFEERTALQKDEAGYYMLCGRCDRTIYEILRDGCSSCANNQPNLSLKQAELRKQRYNKITEPETWTSDTPTDQDSNTLHSDSPLETPPQQEFSIKQRVDTLGLSVRVTNCMRMNKIETIEDLLAYSEDEIKTWRSLGRAGLREILTNLEGKELSLRS
jgi:molecular chaperone DnaK